MSKPLKVVPKFKAEEEERVFWESQDSDSTAYMDWSKSQIVAFPGLCPLTKTISLRLSENLLNIIRAKANKLEVRYQFLMMIWLTEKANESSVATHGRKKDK